jgi:hypothetical protein
MHDCAFAAQEAGIIIHSIFIGLSYGAETDYDTIRALTIALGFHQVRAVAEMQSVPIRSSSDANSVLSAPVPSLQQRSLAKQQPVRCCPACPSASRLLAAAAVSVCAGGMPR